MGFGLGFFRAKELGYTELVFAQLFVWGLGDAVSTLLALSTTGNLALEANPIARTVLIHEPMLLLVLKGAIAVVVGITLIEFRDTVTSVPFWRVWMFGIFALGTAVVMSNLYVGLSVLAY